MFQAERSLTENILKSLTLFLHSFAYNRPIEPQQTSAILIDNLQYLAQQIHQLPFSKHSCEYEKQIEILPHLSSEEEEGNEEGCNGDKRSPTFRNEAHEKERMKTISELNEENMKLRQDLKDAERIIMDVRAAHDSQKIAHDNGKFVMFPAAETPRIGTEIKSRQQRSPTSYGQKPFQFENRELLKRLG